MPPPTWSLLYCTPFLQGLLIEGKSRSGAAEIVLSECKVSGHNCSYERHSDAEKERLTTCRSDLKQAGNDQRVSDKGGANEHGSQGTETSTTKMCCISPELSQLFKLELRFKLKKSGDVGGLDVRI